MGLEIQVNSLDELCDLMCDNAIPKRRKQVKRFNPPKHGHINSNSSRLYPGAEVKVLAYIESTDQYQVESVETGYTCDVSSKGLSIDKE